MLKISEIRCRFRKPFVVILILITFCFALVGCGSEKSAKQWEDFTDPLATDLIQKGVFDDELAEIDDQLFYSMYGIESTLLKEYKVFMSSGGSADEIGIFFCNSDDDAIAVEDMVKVRLKDQISVMENYIPDEVIKLQEAALVRTGPYVVLCVSADSDKAKEIINSYSKK